MAVGIPGVGMVRFLSIGIGLNDQFSQGAAKMNAQVNAMTTAMAGMDRQMNLIRSKLFLTGFATATVLGGVVKQGAMMETQLTLASHAAGGVADNYGRLRKEAKALGVEFGVNSVEVASVLRSVSQLGIPQKFTDDLTRASLLLQQVTGGEIEADFVAETIFRIAQATSKTNEEFEAFLDNSSHYASAMKIVGDMSAAGPPDVARMAAAFQSLGTIANLSAQQILVLAGGLGDVDPGARQAFGTALSRIFSDKFLDPETIGQVAQMMGKTSDEIVRMRREDPFTLITQFAQALSDLKGEVPSIEILEGLHFTQRDKRLFAAITQSGGKMEKMMKAVNAEFAKSEEDLLITQQMADMSNTMAFTWTQLGAAVTNFADTVSGVLAPVLMPLLKMMTAFVDLISKNKFISGTITITALAAVIASMVNGIREMRAMAALSGAGNLVESFSLRGGARTAGRAGGRLALGTADKALLLASFLPFGLGKRFAGKTGAGLAASFKGRAGAGLFSAQRGAGEIPGIAKTLGGKSAVSRSGGIFAQLLGGLGGQAGARAAGGLAARQIGGKALINVIPVVGQIISLLSLLEKPFGMMADTFKNMSERGGALSTTFKFLSMIMRVFQFLGAVINGAINTIINAVKALWDWIQKIPGVEKTFDAIGKGFDKVGDFLGDASDKVRGGFTFNQTNNFSTQAGSEGARRQSEQENATRAGGALVLAPRSGA